MGFQLNIQLNCSEKQVSVGTEDQEHETWRRTGAKLELMGGGAQLHQDLYDIQIKDNVF